MVGIENVENKYHCAINSLLQVLSAFPVVRELLSGVEAHPESVVGATKNLLQQLVEVQTQQQQGRQAGELREATAALSSETLRSAFARINPLKWAGGSEGDMMCAVDVLQYLLQEADELMHKPTSYSSNSSRKISSCSSAGTCASCKFESPHMQHTFGLNIMGRCPRCAQTYSHHNSCLHVPNVDTLKTQHARHHGETGYDLFSAGMQLSPCCNLPMTAIWTKAAPEVLVISLPAEWRLQERSENNITLVPERLVLPGMESGALGPPYELRGVVCYYTGHFSAAVQHEVAAEGGRLWFTADDAKVEKMGTWADVVQKCSSGKNQPRMLFYQRVKAHC
jgi:hypothetical protein